MEKVRRYLFCAGIIAIVLAACILVADFVFTGIWLSTMVDTQVSIVNIMLSVFLFSFSALVVFHGITVLRYSKAEENTTRKYKAKSFLMGTIYYVGAACILMVGVLGLARNLSLVFVLVCFISPAVLFVIGLLNHLAYAKFGRQKQNLFEPEFKNQGKISFEQVLERLQVLVDLRNKNLISEEEFDTMREELFEKNKGE